MSRHGHRQTRGERFSPQQRESRERRRPAHPEAAANPVADDDHGPVFPPDDWDDAHDPWSPFEPSDWLPEHWT